MHAYYFLKHFYFYGKLTLGNNFKRSVIKWTLTYRHMISSKIASVTFLALPSYTT